jgi:pimeloyl-ACP methyl ester carboxylesterase
MVPDPSSARRPLRAWQSIAIAAIAVIVVLATFTWQSFDRDIDAARARVATGSRIAETTCGRIEYAVAGAGSPVLVVHGAGGGFDQGLAFGQPLIDAGFQVIAPSRFGYLRTPLPADASPAAQADAHACLLDTLGLARVAVFGGSAGSPSAMQLCLRHPQRCSSLSLAVPLAYAPRDPALSAAGTSPLVESVIEAALSSDFVFWAASKLARETVVQLILATPAADVRAASASEQARVRRVLREILPIRERAAGLLNDGAIARSLPRYELERLYVPTLVISVEDDLFDTYRNARYTAEHLPRARFVGFATGGHLWVGHQDALWQEVLSLLQQETAPATH